MTVPERPGILGRITTIFGQYGISVETIEQKSPSFHDDGQSVPLIFIFFDVKKSVLLEAIDEIINLKDGTILSLDNVMRVEK